MPSSPTQADLTLQAVVDSIRDYAIFRLDENGCVASWSKGAEAIKGYTAEEIIGKSIETFYTPEDRAAGRPKELLEIARSKGRVEDEGWRVRKDRTRFWADVVISAIRGEDGSVVGFAKVTRDLTERRVQDEARQQAAARFQAIVESTRDYAIFALDPQGYVATWNPGAQRIKGYTADEIIGQHFSKFYPPTVGESLLRTELETALTDGRFEDEGWRVRKDGSRFWANVVITPLYGADGQHIGFSKITRDLTERRKWEADRFKLVQANEAVRLRDEFLSIASHELRTPLMALQLQLDVLLEQRSSLDVRLATKLDRANRNAQRLSDLTTALLDVTRIASGTLKLVPVPTDVSSLVTEVIEQLAEPAELANCTVTAEVEPDVHGILDPMRVGQVISNLLANAFKYAAGTAVEVVLHRTPTGLILRVRDHGPGIAPEDREKVFVRFERGAAPRNLGGLGLGLYVAQQIVTAHGGRISAGDVEGGGAEFTVELPLARSAIEAA